MMSRDRRLFLAVLDILDPMEKACLLLTVIGEMSLRECATVLKISKDSVNRIIAKGKERARTLKAG